MRTRPFRKVLVRNALWLVLLCATQAIAARPTGWIGGRLVLIENGREVSVFAAEQLLKGQPLSLDLRQGASVVEADLSPDGYFVVRAPPGDYRIEYLRVGEKAEFIEPQQLHVEEGTLTCAGTLQLDTGRVEKLGQNEQSTLTVVDDCTTLWSKLKSQSGQASPRVRVELPTTGPIIEHLEPDDPLTIPSELHLEVAGLGTKAARATFTHRFRLNWQPYIAFDLHASAGAVMSTVTGSAGYTAYGPELTAGAGFNFLGGDLIAYGGFRQLPVPINLRPVGGLYFRIPVGPFGIGVRGELWPYQDWNLFIDLSPVALVGGLL